MQRYPSLLLPLVLVILFEGKLSATSLVSDPAPFFESIGKNNTSILPPNVPIVSNTSPVCGDGLNSVQLIATGNAANIIIRWYDVNSTLVGEGSVLTIDNVTTTHAGDYYAIAFENGMPSAPSEITSIEVSSPSNAYAGEDQFICVENNSTYLSAIQPIGVSGVWTSDSNNPSGAIIINPDSNVTLVTGLTTGVYVFKWTLSTGGCGITTDEVTIEVGGSLPPPSYFGDDGVCNGELLFMQGFDALPNATYHWEGPNGFVSDDQNVYIEPANISHAGEYTLTYVTAEGCESQPYVHTISLYNFQDFPTILSNAPLCMGDTLKLQSPTLGEQYEWISPQGASLVSLSLPGLVTNDSETEIPFGGDAYLSGFWKLRVTDNNGCTATSDSINVEIHALPNTPLVNAPSHVCVGEDIELQVPTIPDANYYWYTTENGTADSALVSQLQNPTISNLEASDTPYEFCAKVEVNGCFSTLEPSLASVDQSCNDLVELSTLNIPFSGANSIQVSKIGGILWQLDYTHVAGNPSANELESIWQDSINGGGTIQYRIPFTSGGGYFRLVILKGANWVSFDRNGENYSIKFFYLNDPDLVGYQNYFVVCPEYSDLGHTTPNFTGQNYSSQVNRLIFQSVENFISEVGTDPLACAKVEVTSSPELTPSNNGGVCGDSLKLFSNIIEKNPPYTFLWEGPNGFVSDLENPIIPFPNSNNEGSYTVTVTDSLGCASMGVTQVNLITNVPNQPFIFSNQPICVDEELKLSTLQFSGNIVHYEWNGPNGTSTSNGDFPNAPQITLNNVDASNEGDYSVSVTVDGCTSFSSANHFVKINTTPSANPISNWNTQNCVDDTTQVALSANPSGGNSPYQFTWSGPDNFSSNVENPILGNLGLEKTGNYSLVVSDNNGCESEVGNVLLEFLEKPNTPVIQPQGSICYGETLVLNISEYEGTDVTYHWLLDGDDLNNNSNFLILQSLSIAQSGNYQAFVSVNGCDSDTASWNVNINSELQISLSDIILENTNGTEDLDLVANISGGTSPYNFYWTGPNGFISTSMTPELMNVTSSQSGVYTLEVSDALNCTSEMATMNVTITDKLEAPVFNSINPICHGESIELSLQNYADNSVSYHWSHDGIPFSNNSPTFFIPMASVSHSGMYEVYVFRSGFPSDTTSIELTVNDEISVAVPNHIINCADGMTDLNLIHSYTGGVPPFEYSWTGPNGFLSDDKNPILPNVSNENSGIYSLTLTDDLGCNSNTSSSVVHITDGIFQPQITSTGAVCENANVLLQVAPYTGGTVNYEWYLDGNLVGGNSSQLEIYNSTLTNAGEYSVQVEVDGCASTSTIYDLEIFEKPTANPTNNGTPCSNGLSDLTLNANPSNGMQSLDFYWTGPNGFVSTYENPVIPNSNSSYSGTYILTVTNANGCTENSSTIVTITDVPNAPVVDLISNNTLCEGESLEISTSNFIGNSVEYFWHTPNGIFPSSNSTFVLDSVTLQDDGNYSVEVNVDGCISQLSAHTNISIADIPTVPSISATATCEGEPILFFANEVLGANYYWTSANGFNSTNQNPIISSASLLDTGFYSLIIEKNGCIADSAAIIHIGLNPTPDTPLAINDGESCEGGIVQLIVPNAQPNQTYTWFYSSTNAMVGTGDTLEILNISPSQSGSYYVVANAQGCDSAPSLPTEIIVNTSPTQTAFAGNDMNICGDASVTLNAIAPIIGSGEWTTLGGAIISNPNTATTEVFNLSVGENIFIWALSNGDCTNYSSDTLKVTLSDLTNEIADAGLNQNLCENDFIGLSAIAPNQGTGMWTQSTTQQSFGVTIQDPSNPNTIITGLTSGNTYVFTWSLSVGVCENFSTDEVTITIDEMPQDIAYAGEDAYYCDSSVFELKAVTPSQGNGVWTTSSDATIISPNNTSTNILNLAEGENIFYWTLSHGSCEDYSFDSIIIKNIPSPIAVGDEISVFVNTLLENFDLTINDDIADDDFEISLLSFPENGVVEFMENGLINYMPNDNFVGSDFFEYQICNTNCPNECDVATVEVTVSYDANNAAQETFVPSIITPNGDGTNDAFVIPSLVNFPNNQLKIFNRWGDEVFSAQPYQNDWTGTYNNYPLPEGSYFYMFYTDKENPKKLLNGYLVIKR